MSEPAPSSTHGLALVTVPTLNELKNLHVFMQGILDLHDENLHVLVADDDSLDGTWRTYGTKYAADSKRCHLLRRPGHDKGRGFALRDAWKWALEHQPRYDYVIEMAGNRTDDPAFLPQILARLAAGADVVVCERSAAPGGAASTPRKSWGLGRTLVGAPVTDYESGYRGFSRRALELIKPATLRSGDHCIKAEVMARVGRLRGKHSLKIETIPVPFNPPDATHVQGGNAGLGTQLGLFLRRLTGSV
ncbi:MAG: glycosyltransferase [Planctomycetota bacterium]